MRAVIHADSSAELGSGHVVRSLALGRALVAAGWSVELASTSLLDGHQTLAQRYAIRTVARDAAARRPDWVVVDGYHLGSTQRAALAEPDVPRLVFDDLGADASDATLVVNGNLYASPGRWGAVYPGDSLLGPAYASLHPEIARATPDRDQPAVAGRAVVTMGGSDPRDATRVAIDALSTIDPRVQARIVIGAAHPAATEREQQARDAGFEVVRSPRSLARELAWCDIVVSACGSTILEAVRLGRPVVGVVIASNQRLVADALERAALGVVAGPHPGVNAGAIASAFATLQRDLPRREAIAALGPQVVDGTGAQRIAQAMTAAPLRLRAADAGDSDRLLAWRNDTTSLQASFDARPVGPAEHQAWLTPRLASERHRIWIGELRGAPVGVVRFEMEGAQATISITVAPEQRRGGIGTRLIAAGLARLAAERRQLKVLAWVRVENVASVGAFRAAGFRIAESPSPDRLLLREVVAPVR